MTMRLRILQQKRQGLCVGRCLERPALDLKRRPHVGQGKVGTVLAADAARTLRMALLFLNSWIAFFRLNEHQMILHCARWEGQLQGLPNFELSTAVGDSRQPQYVGKGVIKRTICRAPFLASSSLEVSRAFQGSGCFRFVNLDLNFEIQISDLQ